MVELPTSSISSPFKEISELVIETREKNSMKEALTIHHCDYLERIVIKENTFNIHQLDINHNPNLEEIVFEEKALPNTKEIGFLGLINLIR